MQLVDFVLTESGSINLNFLTYETFSHHKRIEWKKIHEKWNKTHTYNLLTLKTMKRDFYQWIKEPELELEFFSRKERELLKPFAPLFEHLAETMKQVTKGISINFQEVAEPMKRIREGIKRNFPEADLGDSTADFIMAAQKLPIFKGIDIEDLTPRETLQIIEEYERKKSVSLVSREQIQPLSIPRSKQ